MSHAIVICIARCTVRVEARLPSPLCMACTRCRRCIVTSAAAAGMQAEERCRQHSEPAGSRGGADGGRDPHVVHGAPDVQLSACIGLCRYIPRHQCDGCACPIRPQPAQLAPPVLCGVRPEVSLPVLPAALRRRRLCIEGLRGKVLPRWQTAAVCTSTVTAHGDIGRAAGRHTNRHAPIERPAGTGPIYGPACSSATWESELETGVEMDGGSS